MTLSKETPLLNDLEVEVIDLFVSVTRLAGLPKSYGEIYGLLFISPRPLPMDEIVERLGISKGSASQGLRQLRNFGAVRVTYIPGDRRDHYQAETELKKLAAGFLKEQIEPHLDNAPARLERIRQALQETPEAEREEAEIKVRRLANWHKRSSMLLPVILRLIGK